MTGIIDTRKSATLRKETPSAACGLEVFDKTLLQLAVEQMVLFGVRNVVILTEDVRALTAMWGTGELWGCELSVMHPKDSVPLLLHLREQSLLIGNDLWVPALRVLKDDLLRAKNSALVYCVESGVGSNAMFTEWGTAHAADLLHACFSTQGMRGLAADQHQAVLATSCIIGTSMVALLKSQLSVLRAHADDYLLNVREVRPGVYAERGVVIDERAVVTGPVYLGAHVRLAAGASVSGPAVIGRNAAINGESMLVECAIQPHMYVGRGTRVHGEILTPQSTMPGTRSKTTMLCADTRWSLWQYLMSLLGRHSKVRKPTSLNPAH